MAGEKVYPSEVENVLLEMDEVADVFIRTYGGDRDALLISARYPRMEFTFTAAECRVAQRQMEMFVEVGRLPRTAPIETFFVT